MRLIDLLENTPSTGIGAWPKVFRNINVGHLTWNSFLRYNNDYTFEISRDGQNWELSRGYWMFLPQYDWEVYAPEPVKVHWSMEQVIRDIWGQNAVLAISTDLHITGHSRVNILFIRKYGYGVNDSVDTHFSSDCSGTKENMFNNMVQYICNEYKRYTGLDLYDQPTDIQKYKKLL